MIENIADELRLFEEQTLREKILGKKHANAKVFDKVFREIVKKLGIPFNLNFKLGEDFRMIDIVENRNAPVVTFAPFDITGETGFTFSGQRICWYT